MKLIKESVLTVDTVSFKQGEDHEGKPLMVSRFAGKVSFTNCEIEFDELVQPGQFIDEIDFGDRIYLGVFPIQLIAGTTFECTVSQARLKD